MVEGIIVVSTMLIFMGLIIWTRQAYGMKLDMQQRTRSDVMFYASHGCENTGGGIGRPGGGGTVPGNAGPAANAAGKTTNPDAAAVKRSWNSASATLRTTINSQATYDSNANGQNGRSIQYGKLALRTNVSADSVVTCNEKQYTSQLTAWFKFGMDFIKTGGGGADLFR
jgi:hypothetical protein